MMTSKLSFDQKKRIVKAVKTLLDRVSYDGFVESSDYMLTDALHSHYNPDNQSTTSVGHFINFAFYKSWITEFLRKVETAKKEGEDLKEKIIDAIDLILDGGDYETFVRSSDLVLSDVMANDTRLGPDDPKLASNFCYHKSWISQFLKEIEEIREEADKAVAA